jgi:hypothetical protein
MFTVEPAATDAVDVCCQAPPLTCTYGVRAVGVQPELPIVRPICVEALRLAETPVTVTLYVPAAAEFPAANVSTLEVVAGFVPNEAVTSVGNPEAERSTLPENPPEGVMEIVSVPLLPTGTVRFGAEEDSVKLGLPPEPTVMAKLRVLVQPLGST